MESLMNAIVGFSLPPERIMKNNTCKANLSARHFTTLQWCLHVNSFHSAGIMSVLMEQWLAEPRFRFWLNTPIGRVPLAPGDRCVTAACREPGDPNWQNERPVSQLAVWLTGRKNESSLTVTLTASYKCGSVLKRWKGWMCHSQFTQRYTRRCSDLQRHPGTRDVD